MSKSTNKLLKFIGDILDYAPIVATVIVATWNDPNIAFAVENRYYTLI